MRKIDVDGHFTEPVDWFERHAPELAKKVPKWPILETVAEALVGDALSLVPEALKPNPIDLFPDEHKAGIQQMVKAIEGCSASETQAILTDMGLRPLVGYDADARLAMLDEHDIDVQFLLPTSGMTPYKSAKRAGKTELELPCLEAYNSWALKQVEGHADRLLPVILLDLEDLAWAKEELRRAQRAGGRLFQVRMQPVGDRSLAHTDFDEFWSLAEELEMGLVFHVSATKPKLNGNWINDGVDPRHFTALHAMANHMLPQTALAAMIYNGVLERHPNLPIFVLELGTQWVPHWLDSMDAFAEHLGPETFGYNHPLKPSEYVQRQVRVSSLVRYEHWRPSFDQTPDDILVFSTDFPHPEGMADAADKYLEKMQDVDQHRRERFFAGSVEAVMSI